MSLATGLAATAATAEATTKTTKIVTVIMFKVQVPFLARQHPQDEEES